VALARTRTSLLHRLQTDDGKRLAEYTDERRLAELRVDRRSRKARGATALMIWRIDSVGNVLLVSSRCSSESGARGSIVLALSTNRVRPRSARARAGDVRCVGVIISPATLARRYSAGSRLHNAALWTEQDLGLHAIGRQAETCCRERPIGSTRTRPRARCRRCRCANHSSAWRRELCEDRLVDAQLGQAALVGVFGEAFAIVGEGDAVGEVRVARGATEALREVLLSPKSMAGPAW